jgi:hypothetical protein
MMGLWRLRYQDKHRDRVVHLVVDAPSIFEAIWFARQPLMGLHREIGSPCEHCGPNRFTLLDSEALPTPKPVTKEHGP